MISINSLRVVVKDLMKILMKLMGKLRVIIYKNLLKYSRVALFDDVFDDVEVYKGRETTRGYEPE